MISSWIESYAGDNVLLPLTLDTRAFPAADAVGTFDAAYSANTCHIMGWDAVEGMFRGLSRCVRPGGVFMLYGPFNVNGEFTSESNRQFDHSLRARDPRMGLRDLDDLRRLGAPVGLALAQVHRMPANNVLLEWERLDTTSRGVDE